MIKQSRVSLNTKVNFMKVGCAMKRAAFLMFLLTSLVIMGACETERTCPDARFLGSWKYYEGNGEHDDYKRYSFDDPNAYSSMYIGYSTRNGFIYKTTDSSSGRWSKYSDNEIIFNKAGEDEDYRYMFEYVDGITALAGLASADNGRYGRAFENATILEYTDEDDFLLLDWFDNYVEQYSNRYTLYKYSTTEN